MSVSDQLFEQFQLGLRTHNGTETVSVKVARGLLASTDCGFISVQFQRDFSEELSAVNYNILLQRLEPTRGI